MAHYRVQKITLSDPNNPYEPKDRERVLTMHVDPNTPEGQLIASMLFGMDDDGADVDPAVLDRLYDSPCRYTQHWNPVTKKPYIRERYKTNATGWVTHPAKVKSSAAFRNGSSFPHLTRERNQQFLENERVLRAEIYPRYVEEAAQAWIAKDRNDLEAFVNARARLLVVAEAAGIENEAVAIDGLRAAVQRIRDAQGL